MRKSEEIFFEEIDELISGNFSDCSSFVEVIDGFGRLKTNEDKANFLRTVILNAIDVAQNEAYNQALDDGGEKLFDKYVDSDNILAVDLINTLTKMKKNEDN